MNTFYQPSGKFSSLSFLLFLLTATFLLPILGLVYAYALWYIPFIYLNLVLVFFFGGAVGWIVGYMAIKMGKVRNTTLATAFAVAGALIALYFQWAVWLDLVVNAGENYSAGSLGITVSNIKFLQVFTLVTRPDIMLQIMGEVYNSGTWGIFGGTVSGVLLGIVWLLETVGVILASVIVVGMAVGKPFDESSDAWMNEVEIPICNYIENPVELAAELQAGNYEYLKTLQFVANAEESHSVFTIYHADHTDYYLSIENKLAVLDKDGKNTLQSHPFLSYLSINNTAGLLLLNKTA